MARFFLLALCLFFSGAQAFTASPMPHRMSSAILMSEDQESIEERGVSFDQDGKSNVWAIEPKVEVSVKSSEETTQSALIAGGAIVAALGFAAVALSNLPDPSQY
eukprot:CAMPEP_0198142656 /NCGR_PEP_ID=MMETSP1443-20131203/5395_1 /TAXON_ID=186043 /ORGANISM="Entomoneis sp., Strain CCMP2396" /LENGTH=104 /DNA_ID=CAMNT_0043805725 /DNA_START=96 /DNA_END=410 /DNA_ORIENTATION=-